MGFSRCWLCCWIDCAFLSIVYLFHLRVYLPIFVRFLSGCFHYNCKVSCSSSIPSSCDHWSVPTFTQGFCPLDWWRQEGCYLCAVCWCSHVRVWCQPGFLWPQLQSCEFFFSRQPHFLCAYILWSITKHEMFLDFQRILHYQLPCTIGQDHQR